jgi:large subunit ribosomal protein L13
MTSTKSTLLKKEDKIEPQWFVVDADAQIVGRLASRIATVLMGKHKPSYTPHVECGDYVIVINAERVRFSGKPLVHPKYPYLSTKMVQKVYERFTGYPGGQRFQSGTELWDKHPERILREAVRRMLPKNKLASQMLKKLKLYVGNEHPHQSQQPSPFPDYV